MKWFVLLVLCFVACDERIKNDNYNMDNEAQVKGLMNSLRPVVDTRWSPPLCFLAVSHYRFNGGPALVNVPCESIKSSANKVVIGLMAEQPGCQK